MRISYVHELYIATYCCGHLCEPQFTVMASRSVALIILERSSRRVAIYGSRHARPTGLRVAPVESPLRSNKVWYWVAWIDVAQVVSSTKDEGSSTAATCRRSCGAVHRDQCRTEDRLTPSNLGGNLIVVTENRRRTMVGAPGSSAARGAVSVITSRKHPFHSIGLAICGNRACR
jgi:hypothetical protein